MSLSSDRRIRQVFLLLKYPPVFLFCLEVVPHSASQALGLEHLPLASVPMDQPL